MHEYIRDELDRKLLSVMKELFVRDRQNKLHESEAKFSELTNDEWIYYQEEALDQMASQIREAKKSALNKLN